MSLFRLSQLDHANIDRKIYEVLTEQILTGKLAPGTRLTEVDVARQLGVSRTPVREAMKSLANDELVELVPRKGMYIKKLELNEVMEIYDIRAVLEGLAVTLATPRMSEDTIEDLRERATLSMQKLVGGHKGASLRFDREMHRSIAEYSGNQRLAATIEALSNMVNFFRINIIGQSGQQIMQAMGEHLQVIEAMSQRDTAEAEKTMRQHITNTKHNIRIALLQ